jgi:hypothetical protein
MAWLIFFPRIHQQFFKKKYLPAAGSCLVCVGHSKPFKKNNRRKSAIEKGICRKKPAACCW